MKIVLKIFIASLFVIFFFQSVTTNAAKTVNMEMTEKIIHLSHEKEKKCPIHGETLKKGKVPISYGLFRFKPEYREARENKFPYANSTYLGGCIVREAKFADVQYCDKCRAAEKKWHKENKM